VIIQTVLHKEVWAKRQRESFIHPIIQTLERMDIQTAKQISIAEYLHSLGYSPVRRPGTRHPCHAIGDARGHDGDREGRKAGRLMPGQHGLAVQDLRAGECGFGGAAHGRAHAAHTRHARTDSDGRAQEGGTEEAEGGRANLPQEGERRPAVRRRRAEPCQTDCLP